MGQAQLRPWLRLQLRLRLWSYKNILINRSQAVSGSFSVELWHANAARIVRSLHANNNNVNRQWDSGTDSETVGQTPVNRACLNGWLIRRVNVYLALLIEFLPRWSINSSSSTIAAATAATAIATAAATAATRFDVSIVAWQDLDKAAPAQSAHNWHLTHIFENRLPKKRWVCCVCQCRSRLALRG